MRNDWVSIRKSILATRPLLLTCACALSALGFSASSGRNSSRLGLDSPQSPDTLSRPIEIYRYSRSQVGAMRVVVQTREDYDRLWKTLRRAEAEKPPEVDFTKEMLIVAGMGYQPQVGSGIQITSARDTARVLEITVDLRIPTATCNKEGYAAREYPAVMARVPRSRSTVVFRDRLLRSC